MQSDSASETRPDIGRKTFMAAVWAFGTAMGRRAITLAGVMLLARVLAPHEFGLVSFAMLYLTVIDVIGDFGAGSALVYWPDRRDDAAQTTFLVNAVAGVFWMLFTLAIAPAVADFFHAPQGVPLLRVLAVTTLIQCLGNTHDALVQKDLRFHARAVPDVMRAAVKAAVALTLAWMGFGAWSLVWGHLAGILIWTILLWKVVPWRPSRRIPPNLLAPMLRYGRSVLAVQVLSTMLFYMDAVAVGRFIGVRALGLYEMASRIPDSTVMVLVWVTAGALFPAFAKLHAEGADVRGAYLIATRCVASLMLPAALGLFFLGRPIILTFFGRQWVEAAPILSILALYVGFRGLDEVGNVLKATGRTNILVRLMVLKAVMSIPAVIFAARFSAVAVAGALAVVYGLASTTATVIASRVLEIPLRSIAAAFARSAAATAVMSAVLWLWMRWTGALLPVAQLTGGLFLGSSVYLAALRVADPEIFEWFRGVVLRRGKPSTDLLSTVPGK